MRIVKILEKYMLLITFAIMFIATLLGLYYHSFFLILKLTLPIALFMMLFKPMVYLNIGDLVKKRSKDKVKYIVILTILYVAVFPLLTYLLLQSFISLFPHMNPALFAGVVLIGLAPLPSSAPAFTNIAGGKVQLTLIGVIWTFSLSLLIMPLYAALILNAVISVPVMILIQSLVIYIIIPLFIGQITKYGVLKYRSKETLEKLKEPLSAVSLIGMYWMVFVVFGINALLIMKNPILIAIGVILMNIYFLIRMLIAYYSGKAAKIPLEQNISLFYSAATNMTISTAIAISTFGSMAAIGTALGGPFSDMLLMIIFAHIFKKIKNRRNA